MNIKEAHQNLLSVLANARIEMPAGSLTGQEHVILQNSLQLLFNKAGDAEEFEKENKELKEALDDIKKTKKEDKE